jgi:flagellar basal-body rod modification protein FlgD
MAITGINSNDPVSLFGAAKPDALDKDAFMGLLATQMKNQDPLSPTDNSQMIAQLAQFSSLEQMQNLNSNLVGMAVLQQTNALLQQLTSSSGLINKDVQYLDPADNKTKLWGRVESVKIEEGVATLQIGGESVPLVNVVQIGTPPAPSALRASNDPSRTSATPEELDAQLFAARIDAGLARFDNAENLEQPSVR